MSDGRNVEQEEGRLVDRAAAGDRDARRQLFERFRDDAYRVALRVTGRNEDALDVVQDSFIKVFERLDRFQRESGFRTWLLRVVTNQALDLLRARRVRTTVAIDREDDGEGGSQGLQLPAESADAGGSGMEQHELADRLRVAIESLSPDQRAVFALYANGELTYGEIAEMLGVPIGTVMSRLYYARLKLQKLLPDLAPTGASEPGP